MLVILALLVACTPTPAATQPASPQPSLPAASATISPPVKEVEIQPIPLVGLASLPNAEFSGLAWYGDWLILLPQYPARFPGGAQGALLALAKSDLLAFLDGTSTAPLAPRSIPLIAPDLLNQVRGYEGFEAVAVIGNRIYLSIETNTGAAMLGYLVSGQIAPDLSAIRLDTAFLRPLPAQAVIPNFSDETIIAGQDRLFTVYESNGVLYNPRPVARQFDLNLVNPETPVFPNLEYRITDATPIDADGFFWVLNYFFPGDTKISPQRDPIAEKFGKGSTHAQFPQVERLVKMQYKDNAFSIVDAPSIQLSLVDKDTARNWEGLACLDSRGFLLITDQYPRTILAFVPGKP
jgi:hypothetical protein